MICEYEYWEHRKPIILLNAFIIMTAVMCNVACCKRYTSIFSGVTFLVLILYPLFFIYVGTNGPDQVGTTDWFWLAPIFVLPFALFAYAVAHKVDYIKKKFKELWVTWGSALLACIIIIVELAAERQCQKQAYYLVIPLVISVLTMRDYCYYQN